MNKLLGILSVTACALGTAAPATADPATFPGRLDVALAAAHSHKCLDVDGASLDDGVVMIQHACHAGLNQRWVPVPAGRGTFRIMSVHSGKCLDVPGASLSDDVPIIQYACHDGLNQRWALRPSRSGLQLQVQHSKKCFDVRGASTADGAAVVQNACASGTPSQSWFPILGLPPAA